MNTLIYVKARLLSLRFRPAFTERWLEERISDDPRPS